MIGVDYFAVRLKKKNPERSDVLKGGGAVATDRAEIKRTVVTRRKALTPRADAEAGFQDRFPFGEP